jgi:hypothetical protein
LVAVVALATLAVGCGDDDDDNDAAGAPTTAAQVGDESEPSAAGTTAGTSGRTGDTARDQPSTGGGDDRIRECVFVDTPVVSEAMGEEMELVLSFDEGCEWRATADSAVQTFVTLIPEDEYDVEGADPVDGIGDEAYVKRRLVTETVFFRIGDDRYSVEAGDLNSSQSYVDAMLDIAEAVAANA